MVLEIEVRELIVTGSGLVFREQEVTVADVVDMSGLTLVVKGVPKNESPRNVVVVRRRPEGIAERRGEICWALTLA